MDAVGTVPVVVPSNSGIGKLPRELLKQIVEYIIQDSDYGFGNIHNSKPTSWIWQVPSRLYMKRLMSVCKTFREITKYVVYNQVLFSIPNDDESMTAIKPYKDRSTVARLMQEMLAAPRPLQITSRRSALWKDTLLKKSEMTFVGLQYIRFDHEKYCGSCAEWETAMENLHADRNGCEILMWIPPAGRNWYEEDKDAIRLSTILNNIDEHWKRDWRPFRRPY